MRQSSGKLQSEIEEVNDEDINISREIVKEKIVKIIRYQKEQYILNRNPISRDAVVEKNGSRRRGKLLQLMKDGDSSLERLFRLENASPHDYTSVPTEIWPCFVGSTSIVSHLDLDDWEYVRKAVQSKSGQPEISIDSTRQTNLTSSTQNRFQIEETIETVDMLWRSKA
ncbi:hypothetical protein SUGI_0951750 [Cryptomeria japonica]|nr:hypothetical protein SUGI_0951750 [Cryptomeria japonica]